MTVVERDNRWFVIKDVIIGPFHTHADAWRWINHNEGESISRSESIPVELWNSDDE
jgi:hypothetical protein